MLKTLYLCRKHAKLLEGNNREVMTALEVMKSAPSARRPPHVDAANLQEVLSGPRGAGLTNPNPTKPSKSSEAL